MTPALVTIGIPVWNGARTVARAVESVLAQTYPNWSLIVSDNHSDDSTSQIVEDFASRDARITLVSKASTVPAYENFAGLTKGVASPYFAFLAADDAWQPLFLEKTVSALESHLDATLATGQVLLGDQLSTGTFPILDALPCDRVARYLQMPSDNSRYFGLMRSDTVQWLHQALPAAPFFGGDWFQMAHSLRRGKHLEVPEVLLKRDASPLSRYYKLVDHEQSYLFRHFPLSRFSIAMLRTMPVEAIWALRPLLRLNWRAYRQRRALRSTVNGNVCAVRNE